MIGVLLAWAMVGHVRAAPEDCALEAVSSMRVGNGATLDGSVLVHEAGGRVHIGRKARSADGTVVTADVVVLGNGTSVFDVFRGTLRRAPDATIRGTDAPTTFPRPNDCSVPRIDCAGEDVVVEKAGTRLLLPGRYGHLVAGDGAVFAMAPGAYTFCSIRTGKHVVLSIGPFAPTSIDVAGDVTLGDGSLLEVPAGTTIPSLAIGGTRVRLPSSSRVAAFIRSPLARLTVGRTAAFTGGACARTIALARQVAFRCDAAGPPTSSTTPPTTAPTTSTTSPATTTTSTSIAASTTTSSTTMTTSSAPEPTTTSTTEVEVTTSSSSSSSTSTSTSTTSTTTPLGCGNGTVSGGETCDDGNTSDNDSCPADCRIDACTPLTTTQRFVQVHFQPPAGALVAGIQVLLDYPEGLLDLPGNGLSFPSGTISGTPPGATISVNDLNFNGKGHAVRIAVTGAGGAALAAGQIIRLRFQDCEGVPAPAPQQVPCSMLSASDPFLNAVTGVQCFVVIE